MGEERRGTFVLPRPSVWKGKNQQVALAGDDDAEKATVGRDREFAEAEPVKNGNGRWLRDGDFFVGRDGGESGDREPDNVAGFFLGSPFEENARFVGSPTIDAKADAHARELVGIREAADFEDFAVDEIGGFGAVGRNGEAAFVAVERGELFGGVAEDVEILQTGRAGHGVVLLDGDSEIHPGKPGSVAKGAPFVGRRNRARGEARGFDGEERESRHGLGKIDNGVVVREKSGIGGGEDEVVALFDAKFVAGVVEEKRLDGVGGAAAVVLHGGDHELDEEIAAVRRPANGVREVTEELIVARVFLAFEETASLAVWLLDPDIVVLEVVKLGFELAISGKSDGVVGTEGEGGDLVVDGTKRIVEVLGLGGRKKEKRIHREDTERAE